MSGHADEGEIEIKVSRAFNCVNAKREIGKTGAGHQKLCFYDDGNDENVRALYRAKPDGKGYLQLREAFCKLDKNVFKNIGGDTTCSAYDSGKTLMKQYCGAGHKIKSDAVCTEANLGTTVHKELVQSYCSSGDGKSDDWCGCIHAKKGKCDLSDASEYAGCDLVNAAHEDLIGDIPSESLSGGVRRQLGERKHCRAKICDDPDRYVPGGAMDNCTLNLQVCVQDVKVAGHLVDSGIEVNCNNKQNVGEDGGDSQVKEDRQKKNDDAVAPKQEKGDMYLIFGGVFICCCMLLLAAFALIKKK